MAGPTPLILHADTARLPIRSGSVDLIVTSPPYNLGMGYAVGDSLAGGAYRAALAAWGREWHRVLQPRGRLCLNVPLDTSRGSPTPAYYHALQALLDDAPTPDGWNYRGTIVWDEGTVNRRTAWGSFASPSAPFVMAPVETVIVLAKGGSDWKRPRRPGLTPTISPADFIRWTLALWPIKGVSPRTAGRVAAFPLDLPHRLISLYSYREDLILDPCAGSGTTGRAAQALGRRSILVDLDPDAVALLRSTFPPPKSPLKHPYPTEDLS